jgi:hypothetical protein
MRIRHIEWLFALVSLSNAAMANAAVDERVNLLPTEQELARRDACPGGGVLRYAGDPPYAGLPWHLIESVPAIGRQHAVLTRNEAPWIRKLSGPSRPVRIFEHDGVNVVLFDLCRPHRCDAESLYGVIVLPSQDYGLVLSEQGRSRRLGSHRPVTDAALACAKSIDERRRGP